MLVKTLHNISGLRNKLLNYKSPISMIFVIFTRPQNLHKWQYNGNLNGNLNDNEEKVVKMILVNERRTLDDFSLETGISKRTISRIFESLQDKEIIERVGSKRDGYWRVVK